MKLTAMAAFALVGLAVAQTVHSIPVHDVRLVGEIPAEWWTYVKLRVGADGTPIGTYTAPADRHFVVTHASFGSSVRADGMILNERLAGLSNGTRVVLEPRALLTVDYMLYVETAELWGYLEPVR